MMQTLNNIAQKMEYEEDRVVRADTAIATLLELSGVHPDVREAIYRLIEVRSDSAEMLSRLVEELTDAVESVEVVFEVVAVGVTV